MQFSVGRLPAHVVSLPQRRGLLGRNSTAERPDRGSEAAATAGMSSSARLSIGLIGCGEIGRTVHLPLLRVLPGARLVALAEADPQRRREAERASPGTAAVADYRDILARRDVDAVVIALPPSLHCAASIAALEAGKHVYLEKPLASTLAEGRELLAASRGADVVAMIGFNYRCHPLHERARRLLTSGRIGDVLSIRTAFSISRRDKPAWKALRSSGGGVLLDLASHHVDLLRWLVPLEIVAVSAELRSHRSEDDTAAVQLAIGKDITAQCFFTLGGVEEDRIEIHGSAGKLTVDRYRSRDVEVTPLLARGHVLSRLTAPVRAMGALPYLARKLRSPGHEPSYRPALERFIGAVVAGSAAAPDFGDGYMSLAVIDAAERSARTGRATQPEPPPVVVQHGATPRAVESVAGGKR